MTVIVFHAYQFCRGSTGSQGAFGTSVAGHLLLGLDAMIAWFFLVSSFLLYGRVVRAGLAGGPVPSPRDFLVRRAVRLLPLYWIAITAVWALRNPALPGDWRDLLEHLTFTQVFDSKRIFYTIGPAWSLSVEIMFYVALAMITGAVVRACGRRESVRARAWLLALPALAILAVSFAYQAYAVLIEHAAYDDWAAWFGPLAQMWAFGFGMLIAVGVGVRRERPLPAYPLLAMRALAVVLLLGGIALRGTGTGTNMLFRDVSGVGYALLVASSVFAPEGALWRRALALRPFLWVGLISYSIYLWHEPILLALNGHHLLSHAPSAFLPTAVLLLVLGLLAGRVSYGLIEAPARNLIRVLPTRS